MNFWKNKGWVRLHRKIEDNELWFLEPFTKAQAWIDLFLNANHKDGIIQIRGNVISIKRGQIGWSELTMVERWKWSKDKVRRFLKLLETRKQIIQQKDRYITTIITILNYELYQNDTPDNTPDKTADDTAERQQTIHKQECKELKNVNNVKKYTTEFEVFWKEYPNKTGKGKAFESWLKVNPDSSLQAQILDSIEKHKKSRGWQEEDGKYIPHPTTWLNRQSWEDSPPEAKKTGVLQTTYIKNKQKNG